MGTYRTFNCTVHSSLYILERKLPPTEYYFDVILTVHRR